jgi:hypothetical protein
LSDHRPIRTARRKARQQQREQMGIAVPPCVLCIEDHHTAGQNHDRELTAPLCQKHHREIHEQLLQAEISLLQQASTLQRIAFALRASALYDHRRADAMERWASALENIVPKENK